MREFRVQLFLAESKRSQGIVDSIKSIFVKKPMLRIGENLNLKVGRYSKHGYNCVDVYYHGQSIGEIRKSGIDEMMEKGAFVNAKIYDENRVTITCLEPHEYRDKPEYKGWREKIDKKSAADREEREKLFPTELNRMLTDLSNISNPIDRHFLLQDIIGETYKRRKDTEMRKVCTKIGVKHLSEFENLAPFLKKKFGGTLPRVTTFQYLSTLLSEDGKYDHAIKICKMAIRYRLKDGTKGGFEGRIKKLEKRRGQT